MSARPPMVCPSCHSATAVDTGRCHSCDALLTIQADADVTRLSGDATISRDRISAALPVQITGLEAGATFAGRYRIDRLLGAGGMGAVYQAWDNDLGLSIAIKAVRPDVTPDAESARDFERRFKQELLLA